jgi:RNA polymerase sigma factor for flagellar operon FliA
MGKDGFEQELPRIDRVIDVAASRHRLGRTEREDFRSYVLFKLLEDDCRRLRKFRGESRFETYLNVVVKRLFLDFRIERWGKWRASARARKLGKPAVLIERLIYRDGLDRNEAREMLVQHGLYLEPDDFEAILREIPCRSSRGRHPDGPSGGGLSEWERAGARRRIEDALRGGFESLSREDRILLKLRFLDGCTVKQIAGAMGIPERPLYPRLRRVLEQLRGTLEEMGLEGSEVSTVWRERIDIDVASALG